MRVKTKENRLDGVDYELKEVTPAYGRNNECEGCVAENDHDMCLRLDSCIDMMSCKFFVWVKKIAH